jgi:chemotaxis protein methyltransferase CheR
MASHDSDCGDFDDGDFDYLARLLRDHSGLALSRDRAAMAYRRLAPVMHRYGFRRTHALIADLRLGHAALAEAVIEAMTVNETSFFRDPDQYRCLTAEVLPRLIAARGSQRRLRLWSAACASGQEAWSLAMLLDEMDLPRRGWHIELIATDLCAAAIARAEAGRYSTFEIERGLGTGRLARYLSARGGEWEVADSLRPMVRFRHFNLLDSFDWLENVDVVLCRNVLMYFDSATRGRVLTRMADTLAGDGVLVLGESESGEDMPPGFCAWPAASGIYRRSTT